MSSNLSEIIYLDNNATTPLAPEVLQAINSAAVNAFGNPSSTSSIGKAARGLINEARAEIALMVGGKPLDIVFTSGGTECNNWVIYSVIKYFYSTLELVDRIPHVVTTNVEHDSVRLPLEEFVKEKKLEVTYLPVNPRTGVVSTTQVLNAIESNTCLVSIMLANNETGVIFPVQEICQAVKQKTKFKQDIFFHTDASQAIGKIPINVRHLGVDYLTITGHKFYGPRIGALYVNNPGVGCPLTPIFFGGGQERNFRPGTENTPMIIGLGAAAKLVNENLDIYAGHMLSMKEYLKTTIKKKFPEDVIHFNDEFKAGTPSLPNTVSVGFYRDDFALFTTTALLNNMSRVVVSAGAACHASSSGVKPSAVLLSCGVSHDVAMRTLRISVGRQTNKSEVEEAVSLIYSAVCQCAQIKL